MTDNKWARLLAYVTGLVNQKLLLQNEYLIAENRILRAQLPQRLQLTDPQRSTLAEIGKRLGRKALGEVAVVARPETILAWYRRLIAQKFDGSKFRKAPGRPPVSRELVDLIDSAHSSARSELAAVEAGTGYSISHLLPMVMDIDFDQTTTFRCPVFVIVGEHDYATSHTVAEAWFQQVKAPQKRLIRFNDASHMVMQEQPGRFLRHLVDDVRPLAARIGDAAPDEVIVR